MKLRVRLRRLRKKISRWIMQRVDGRYTRDIKHPRTAITIFRRRLFRQYGNLPSFFIIGAQKSGTTSLHSALCMHPQVMPPLLKEIRYFSQCYGRGLDWYRAHFPVLGDGMITGDATPEYLVNRRSPRLIREILPDARFLVIMRDPVRRVMSQYKMLRCMQQESRSRENAFKQELALFDRLPLPKAFKTSRMLRRSLYAHQLRPWLELFSKDQFLFIQAERFFKEQPAVMSEVYTFLGLTPFEIGQPVHLFKSKYRPLGPEMEVRLREFFAEPNERLFEAIGHRFDWPTTPTTLAEQEHG